MIDKIDQIVESLIAESPKREHDYAYNLFRYNLNREDLAGVDNDPEGIAKSIIKRMLENYEIMSDVAEHRGFLKTATAMVKKKLEKR